ncbi:hypothetical protein NPIL_371301 [Nephila pilipes]|uniref:Uncharacterized protein n=1 Tax=Nephila pilipes TaxID=299642 RepID=A0A8X6UDI7_NEPPI|nr:hypothetical protein NPIL_371301 [Nephila pilipes]
MKASTLRVSENYDTIAGHNSNPFEFRKLPKCYAKEDDKIEIVCAENITEDMENLLPSFREDKINLVKINTSNFIEAQHNVEELALLIQKVEKGKKNENSNLLNQLEKLWNATCSLNEEKDERQIEKQEEEQKTILLEI